MKGRYEELRTILFYFNAEPEAHKERIERAVRECLAKGFSADEVRYYAQGDYKDGAVFGKNIDTGLISGMLPTGKIADILAIVESEIRAEMKRV
jgi:hypothetical protein